MGTSARCCDAGVGFRSSLDFSQSPHREFCLDYEIGHSERRLTKAGSLRRLSALSQQASRDPEWVCPSANIVPFDLMRNRQASALSIPARATAVVSSSYLNDPKSPHSVLRHYDLRCYEKDIPEAIPLFHYSPKFARMVFCFGNCAELHIAIKSQLGPP